MLVAQKSVMGCLRTSQVHVRARLDAVFFQVLANLNCIVKMTRGQFEVLPFYVLAPPPHTPSHSSKPHFESKNTEEGDVQK